jgi:hypothetical protein
VIEQAATSRLRRTGEKAMDAGLVVMLFEATPFFSSRNGDGPAG